MKPVVVNLIFVLLPLMSIDAGVITNTVKDENRRSLLDHQMPDDVVFDLAGRKTLITRDEETDQYNTFKVYEDEGVPFVVDPWSGRKYVVKYSVTSGNVQILPVTVTRGRRPLVRDWSTGTANSVTLNKYGEVELVPIERDKASRSLL